MVDSIKNILAIKSSFTSNPVKTDEENLNIAIIDTFIEKKVVIDKDRFFEDSPYEPDVAHGEVVRKIIQEGLPKAQIDIFDMNKIKRVKVTDDDPLNAQLGMVLENIKNGEKYDALNISISEDCDYNLLSSVTHQKVTPENVQKFKKEILAFLGRRQDKSTIEEIEKINKIAESGTKVYIATGNDGNELFNLLTLSKAKNVGALTPTGEKEDYTADNALINTWAQGSFPVKKMSDPITGEIGFDYTGDGTMDILERNLSSKGRCDTLAAKISGTSFASPTALVNDLKNITR